MTHIWFLNIIFLLSPLSNFHVSIYIGNIKEAKTVWHCNCNCVSHTILRCIKIGENCVLAVTKWQESGAKKNTAGTTPQLQENSARASPHHTGNCLQQKSRCSFTCYIANQNEKNNYFKNFCSIAICNFRFPFAATVLLCMLPVCLASIWGLLLSLR